MHGSLELQQILKQEVLQNPLLEEVDEVTEQEDIDREASADEQNNEEPEDPAEEDPIPLCDISNQGSEHDRFEWRRTQSGLTHGAHSLTIVAFEATDHATVLRFDVFVDLCRADMDGNGVLNVFDFLAFQTAFGDQDPAADFTGDGSFNVFDFLAFQTEFNEGC